MKNFNKTTDDVLDMIWNIAASKKKTVPSTAVETLEDFFIIFGKKLLISLFISIRNTKNIENESVSQVIEVHKDKININFFIKRKVITHIYPIITFYNNGKLSVKDEDEVISNCIIENNILYVNSKSHDNFIHEKIEKIINRLEKTLVIKEDKHIERKDIKKKLITRFPKVIKSDNTNLYELKFTSKK